MTKSIRSVSIHGTRSMYNNHGCRCEPCTNANRIHNRSSYQNGYRRPDPEPGSLKCGSSYAYKRGCRCVECTSADRKRSYSAKYGSGVPDMPENCECCGSSGNKLVLDHDHNTGEFRGWICYSCNIGIGRFGDSIDGLTRVLRYLEKQYSYPKVGIPTGLDGSAKLFRVAYHLKKKFTKPDGNECEICLRDDRRLVLDHNHETDGFRGWLCDGCNVGLANMGDNEYGVKIGIKYLQKVASCSIE